MYYTYISYHFGGDKYKIGVTANLRRRLRVLCMNDKKGCEIVYYEAYDNSDEATKRENDLLKMKDGQLISLIKQTNPIELDLLEKK